MDTAQVILNRLIQDVINPGLLIVFAAALLAFVYGTVVFIHRLSTGKTTEEGKSHMLWGLVGMFIIVSVFGILRVINNTLGFGFGPGRGAPNTGMPTYQVSNGTFFQ